MSATLNTVPASQWVAVNPGVIGAGGTGLDLIELMLTTNTRVPIGAVLSFPSLATVNSFFGATSSEAMHAAIYFSGFDSSTIKPAALLFAQYPTANVGAYLRGGNISSMTLTQLQALSGVLTVTVDGTPTTSSAISLASATSFSAAAELITEDLGLTGPAGAVITAASIGATFTATGSTTSLTVSAVTGVIHPGSALTASITGTGVPSNTYIVSFVSGTPGGAGVYLTNNSTTASGASITCSSTIADVTTVASGTIATLQELRGTSVAAGTQIASFGTGTGGAGTYNLTGAVQQIASEAMTTDTPTVTWDSLSGAFVVVSSTTGASSTIGYGSGTIAAGLALTQNNGATISEGAITGVPATFMATVIAQTQNWASFQTLFDPDNGSGNTQKLLFAAWVNSTNDRYVYLASDTDVTPTVSTAATTSLGYILKRLDSSGTVPIYAPVGSNLGLASFVGGAIASIDFNQTNGRTTLDFRRQTGMGVSVTNQAVLTNLKANGYNYYVAEATANDQNNFFDPGSITGPFAWIDSYVNQIWLNNQCQLALMQMLLTYKSIPYNPVGYGYIRAALADPILAAVNFGAIRANVPLSSAQISEVNAAAGIAIDTTIFNVGWALVIQPATAQVRALRQSPTILLFYMDGQSVQQVNLSSTLIM